MSSGEVLISELFVSRRKERKDLAARWEITVTVGNRSEILFPGSSCPRGICSKKNRPTIFVETTIYRDQIQNHILQSIIKFIHNFIKFTFHHFDLEYIKNYFKQK